MGQVCLTECLSAGVLQGVSLFYFGGGGGGKWNFIAFVRNCDLFGQIHNFKFILGEINQ